ncbi:protein SOGA1 [Denticeps clupeoides]|uniref:SOGA coiled-coil domain-containing protein n=1 Tax=Denticeps clupeoides TaxID=299321 RepID=A0AAY4CGR4_9TELE|nr:protein SOGA1-like [Denticeps clupeoides]XP_028848416.1 protein SOGA1-like [Denticeps clupeoides]
MTKERSEPDRRTGPQMQRGVDADRAPRPKNGLPAPPKHGDDAPAAKRKGATVRRTPSGRDVKPEKGAQKERRKLSGASSTSEDLSKDSGCGTGKTSSTDSGSEVSDCAPEERKLSADAGPGRGTWAPGSISPGDDRSFASPDSRLLAFSDLAREFADGARDELVREIEELRSENEYLKDEVEELRSEMLEMKDVFLEEDMCQLQELQQQLDQANKTCRILQYRLRKAERRSLRVAQTGQVEGELIRTLEHDVRVAKSVSFRLHNELEAVQKKKARLEWENEALRERLQDLEVTQQVLQVEMDKAREGSLKWRNLRASSGRTEKKLSSQEDSADLKCQLHFAKEESALMCKKLTKMAVDNETMREELAKYRLLYGDVDTSWAPFDLTTSPHTREAEVKSHLRLLEEEATLLSRRIVELEVENRGLRAEMSQLRERGGGERRREEDEEDMMEVSEEHLTSLSSMTLNEKTTETKGDRMLDTKQIQTDEGGFGTCSTSQIPQEDTVGGERDQRTTANQSYHPNHSLNFKTLIDLRDQALLVDSAIQLLKAPNKNGFSPTQAYLRKKELDLNTEPHAMHVDLSNLSPLSGGLEALQGQLNALLERMKSLVDGQGHVWVTNISSLEAAEEGLHSSEMEQQDGRCDQEGLVLLAVQLRWFLQQWRQGEIVTGCSSLSKDLFEGPESGDKEANMSPSSALSSMRQSELLADLRTALQDLGSELLEERRVGQEVTQQFARAKVSWDVEKSELKGVISRLQGCGGEAATPDTKATLQRDHVEKLQHLLAEAYAAAMDASRQLKARERSWSREKQELLERLNQSSGVKMSSRRRLCGMERTKHGKWTRTCESEKNWQFLEPESAVSDPGDPCKTWDCPIMPPRFPGLDLHLKVTQRSHTAPERSALRIYYSPPSARRVHLSHAPLGEEDDGEGRTETEKPEPKDRAGDTTTSSFQDVPRDQQDRTVFQTFPSLQDSANLSDDMKEMTASVWQGGHSGQREPRNQTVATQTHSHAHSRSISIGLQTDVTFTATAGKSWSPRVTSSSLVAARAQQVSCSLDQVNRRLDKSPPCSTSPKMHRRHSSPFSSSWSSTSSSSRSSFFSGSLSSSSSLTNPSLMEVSKERGQRSPLVPSWTRPAVSRGGPATGTNGDKRHKSVEIHKYGLVQEFLRNVCGRGEKPGKGGGAGAEKGTGVRRSNTCPPGQKKTERHPSRVSATPLVRSDSVTRIVNRRFMRHSQKEEPLTAANKTHCSRDKNLNSAALEDGPCECSSRSLTSCFARPSRSTPRHTHGQCKPPDCSIAGKGGSALQ